MGNIYEFGSNVDIILRVKANCTIGNESYQPGQIYTILKECGVGLNYEATNSTISGKKPIYNGDTQNIVSSIMVTNVPLNTKVTNLILGFKGKQNFTKTMLETIALGGNLSYLKYEPIDAIFVMNKTDGSILAAENYTIEGDTIKLNDNSLAGDYIIQYKTISSGVVYGLEADYFPYFDIEIVGEGNINKTTKKVYLFFPAVKITQVPQINLDNEGVCSTPFVFNVIYQGQDAPRLVFED